LNQYQQYIALSRYARWLPKEKRRETWEETVARYINFWRDKYPDIFREDDGTEELYDKLYDAIYDLEVMPSMRALMTAGKALDRDNVAGFNCSYREASGSGKSIEVLTQEMLDNGFTDPVTINVSTPIAFDEIMYILLCGTGVGFSCERQVIASLPVVGHKLPRTVYARNDENYPGVPIDELSTYSTKYNKIYVADSKYGWSSALRILITELYNGNTEITWDLSKIRPAGAPLKTFGGRASGPEPLNELFNYTVRLFRSSLGRRLTSVDVHGLVCKIAQVVVVGGVRRSALISLSNLSDDRMRHAKSGMWWEHHNEYALANNSVAYTEKPDIDTFTREWLALMESKSGERGIFNREASVRQVKRNGRRNPEYSFGTNPCSEIILRDRQFCNLSEIVVRSTDTFSDLKRKVRIATILGTLQATLTNFRYLSPKWKQNTEEEALLGVSLTGIMDHPVLSGNVDGLTGKGLVKFFGKEWLNTKDDFNLSTLLEELKNVAIETNKEWSNRLGINQSAAITCVKPSGTVSQLVNSASGIHPRHSPYYIRTVRADAKDPLAQMMAAQGFPWEWNLADRDPDTGELRQNTMVFSFPVESPKDSVFRNDRSAIEQLELWLTYQRYWAEHKPSITVYVKDEEWMDVGAWVWRHFDELSGVSFLPYDGGSYQQAPYQEITEQEFKRFSEGFPEARWEELGNFENTDMTLGSQELACTGGSCEI